MSIFPIIKSDLTVQVGDKVRLSAVKSFITPDEDALVSVQIQPEPAATFIDVFNADQENWYLDWVYSSSGSKVVTLKVTNETVTPTYTTKTMNINVVTQANDCLFSTDDNLKAYEPDILSWLPDGYSSFNHIHRESRNNIVDWLDEIRLRKSNGDRFEARDLLEKEQVRRISCYMTLRVIFEGLSNQVDDVFDKKRQKFQALEASSKNRNYITLDFNDDGQADQNDNQELRTMTMVRR
jgi:hypothetical protein